MDFQLKPVSNSFEEKKLLPDLAMGLLSIIRNIVEQIQTTEGRFEDSNTGELLSKYTAELRPSIVHSLQKGI